MRLEFNPPRLLIWCIYTLFWRLESFYLPKAHKVTVCLNVESTNTPRSWREIRQAVGWDAAGQYVIQTCFFSASWTQTHFTQRHNIQNKTQEHREWKNVKLWHHHFLLHSYSYYPLGVTLSLLRSFLNTFDFAFLNHIKNGIFFFQQNFIYMIWFHFINT